MAIRTHRLIHRVKGMGSNGAQATAGYHPAGTSETPMTMPVARVLVYPASSPGYATIAYHEMTPIWTANGAAIPAVAPGRWGQLAAAGRP